MSIETERPVIDRTISFFHPERTFHKRTVRIPVDDRVDRSAITIRSSDSGVIAYAKTSDSEEFVDIVVKASSLRSPEVTTISKKPHDHCIYKSD